jgi:hypothetical protein
MIHFCCIKGCTRNAAAGIGFCSYHWCLVPSALKAKIGYALRIWRSSLDSMDLLRLHRYQVQARSYIACAEAQHG